MNEQTKLSPKDYASDQEVRWCPGCGDYAILKAVQRVLADIAADHDNTVFISGIGCSSRFPYYLNTYGFHTIHGRAATVATGVKVANPDLDIWVISGDGDSLSIGANHILHLLRKDIDLTYLLFNNEIYGLTKGQVSPTSRVGTNTPTSPTGSEARPVHALSYALGCGARFIARSYDVAQTHLVDTLKRSHAHQGTAFVEILQNCIVYNADIFDEIIQKKVAADKQLRLEHGKAMIFGSNNDKGIILNTKKLRLEAVTIGENGISESDILIHDETNHILASMLAKMDGKSMPLALGVIYCANNKYIPMQKPKQLSNIEFANRLNSHMRKGNNWVR